MSDDSSPAQPAVASSRCCTGNQKLSSATGHITNAEQTPDMLCCRHGELPFYLPPEAFIYTHLPFESYWQLLPRPVSREQWWQMPEVALPFFAAGGQLLEDKLQACTVLPAPR